MRDEGPFISVPWVLGSLALIVGAELVVGLGIGELVGGRALSIGTSFWLRGLAQLAGFFVGGLVVGLVSPGVRVLEPALAAFGAVLLTALTALFVPARFVGLGGSRLVLACAIAFGLALAGAWVGERLTGRLR